MPTIIRVLDHCRVLPEHPWLHPQRPAHADGFLGMAGEQCHVRSVLLRGCKGMVGAETRKRDVHVRDVLLLLRDRTGGMGGVNGPR